MTEAQFQLNLTFLPVEDRLLLKIVSGARGSMAEYRLLLTRRFVRLFWDGLERVLEMQGHNPYIAQEGRTAVIQFQQNAALSQADFSTPYMGEQAVTPLGQHPLLIHKFQVQKGANNNPIISLEATTGQTVNVTCSFQLVCSFRKLLADTIVAAGWDLPCSLVPEGAMALPDTLGSIN
jgi:hypothetical protein